MGMKPRGDRESVVKKELRVYEVSGDLRFVY
jgi:hypothetical protein